MDPKQIEAKYARIGKSQREVLEAAQWHTGPEMFSSLLLLGPFTLSHRHSYYS